MQLFNETATIDEMFELCLDKIHSNYRDFIVSLHEQWEKRQSLTLNQENALKQAYKYNTKKRR